MAYATATEGGFGAAATVIQPDPSHSESINIPDAELLFRGDFHRAGPDLVLTGQDGRHHIIPGYFSTEKHPALVAPNGASLSADLVGLLAGSPAPGQYAQAQPTAHADPIGKVEKVVGDVTVMRNGVSVALHVGDVVYKSDVIHTGGNSSAGIGFPDGTALDLVANTRMALNEYSFEPNASTNNALFTLVEGGFAFVADQVAHTGGVTGGLKIATPVATMGIRGTAGYALEQVATVTATIGNVDITFAVIADPGTDRVGSYVLVDQFGNEVAVNAAGVWTTLSWNGTNTPPTVTQQAMTQANFAIEQQLVPELVNILNNLPTLGPNPQTPGGHPGSGTSPNDLNNNPQQLLDNNNTLKFTGAPITTPSGPAPPIFTISAPNTPPPTPSPQNSSSATDQWIGQSGGSWNSGPNWSTGTPTVPQTVEIDNSTVILNDSESVSGLVLGSGAILDIVSGGSLTVANGISNSGTVVIDSSGGDPILMINGTVFLLDGGTIDMQGPAASNMIIGVPSTGATLVNVNNTIIGSGTIGQGDGNLTLVNGSAGTIEAKALLGTDTGILVIDTGNAVSNSGLLEAAAGGTLQIADNVTNFSTIAANAGGIVNIDSVTISNAGGLIEAIGAVSVLTIDVNTLTNELGATIESSHGGNVTVTELASGSTNQGTYEAVDGGMFTIDELGNATNELSGVIEAINGGTLTINHFDAATNFGMIEALDGGTLTLNDNTSEQNAVGGIVEADGGTVDINLVTLAGSGTGGNFGTFEALSGGAINITGGTTVDSGATIEAIGYRSMVDFSNNLEGAAFENLGTILAQNGGTVSFNGATISSGAEGSPLGTYEADGGTIFVSSDSTLEGANPINVVITGGGLADFADSINHVVDVTFGTDGSGSGTLELDAAPDFDGIAVSVTNFGTGDTIDLTNLPYSTTSGATLRYDTDNHVLTITDGDTTEQFTLNGSYSQSDFALTSGPGGTGTEVVYSPPAAQNLVVNGGFETGTLDGWTTSGANQPEYDFVTTSDVHSGSYALSIGAVNAEWDVYQYISTVSGETYQIEFWLSNPEGGTPSNFTASFGSTTLLSLVDSAAQGYTEYTYDVTATGTSTELLFVGEQNPAYWYLDDVSVVPVTTANPTAPAGVSGSPINLALTDPSGGQGGQISITVSGVPSDWSLNEGTNLGNGTWTVETNDLSALTVMTAAAYVGAMVLGVTETWTNANGSTGIATIADNVEAYAPGAPIFALSGNDTLTGAGGNDEFVFAQPIGNDTIYDFNVATDKIDLTGFAKIASFSDIQANIVEDSNGDAVITIGAGESITLHGVNAASLTEGDFVFNQTPLVENDGNMVVSDGAMLPLGGTTNNTGTIALNSSGDQTELQIIGDGITLEGGGQLTLSDSSANAIVGTTSTSTLTNVDNTISGAGTIGNSGDGLMALTNGGTIDANLSGDTLAIDTGHVMANTGTLEASNGGTLLIDDAVSNSGAGNALIEGGTLDFAAASNVNEITFNNGSGTPTYGELVVGAPDGFSATVNGFAGTAPNLANSDAIDLAGVWTIESETPSGGNLVLELKDGSETVKLTFDDFDGTLSIATVGGNTLITDPPPTGSATVTAGRTVTGFGLNLDHDQISLAPGQTETQSGGSQTGSVSLGGPGNDNFVFHPGTGADTIANFNPQADTIEFDNFANVQNVQQLASLITPSAHGDAVIDLGHHDSITLPGVPTSYLQAHLQSLVHLT